MGDKINLLDKVKLVFLGLTIFGCYSVFTGKNYYPSVRFPEFINRNSVLPLSVKKIKIIDLDTKKEVRLERLLKPFDKRYILFSFYALTQHREDQVFEFINLLKGTNKNYKLSVE